MTIFLTTQYLEEADELAAGRHHRPRPDGRRGHAGRTEEVGRLRRHRRPGGRRRGGRTRSVAGVPGVGSVEAHGSELVVTAGDGAAVISPVAVALAGSALPVRDLTLRTPTLDDVFLELTGSHIERKNTTEESLS